MKIESRANLLINTVGSLLILTTAAFKLIDRSTGFPSSVRSVLYLLFYSLWIVTINWRVIQTSIRRYLIAVASLELFWVLVRSVKFRFLKSETAMRYAWYLYYLPMLMIPALCLLLSISMGKPENYRLKKRLLIFPIISAALFLFVMTNDLHSAVFVIPSGLDGLNVGNYSYGAGFAVIAVYIGMCVAASYGILLVKCRKPGRKFMRFLPLVPLSLCFAAVVINACGITTIFIFNIDITVFICFCTTATLEACIQGGLILTNNGYDELFGMSGIRAVITDGELSPLIASGSYEEIPAGTLKKR